MTEAVKARDWLVDLQAAAEVDDSDGFQSLIVAIANAQPDLKEPKSVEWPESTSKTARHGLHFFLGLLHNL